MGYNGTNFLLLANTGTPSTPAYEAVGCQRDASIEETNDTIDVSCKDQREMRVLNGRYSSTISLDALYVPNDAAYLALQTAMRNGELILVAAEFSGDVQETATVKIDSMSSTYPDQAESTIAISMTLDGAWNVVGS